MWFRGLPTWSGSKGCRLLNQTLLSSSAEAGSIIRSGGEELTSSELTALIVFQQLYSCEPRANG